MIMEKYNMDYVFGNENRKAYMGLAMIWIIGYHFYLVHSDFINHYLFPVKFLFRNGYVGVDIFFILSAFGLCYSWERSTVTCFYKKRFIRIIPLYLVFLVLCKFLLKADFSYWDVFLQITSLSVVNTPYTHTQGINGEWFVPAIINLYVIFPVLFNLVRYINKRFAVYGVYIVSMCSILASGGASSFISPNYIMRLPIIVAGILAYLCIIENNKRKLLQIFVFMSIFYLFVERKNIMLSVPLPLILFTLNELKLKINIKWLCFIGSISFELYLAHVIPMNFIQDYNVAISALILFICTAVIASLLHGFNLLVSKFK